MPTRNGSVTQTSRRFARVLDCLLALWCGAHLRTNAPRSLAPGQGRPICKQIARPASSAARWLGGGGMVCVSKAPLRFRLLWMKNAARWYAFFAGVVMQVRRNLLAIYLRADPV